jgi:hypothetical protein
VKIEVTHTAVVGNVSTTNTIVFEDERSCTLLDIAEATETLDKIAAGTLTAIEWDKLREQQAVTS